MKRIGFILFVVGFVFFGCDSGNGTNGFVSTVNDTVSNDVPTLGLVGTSVSSNNQSVATVEIASGKIRITSVSAGTAVITVSENSNDATINITVSSTGSITIVNIVIYDPLGQLNIISEDYLGFWFYNDTGEDWDENVVYPTFELTSSTIIHKSITYNNIYTTVGGTVMGGAGVYSYVYQNDQKIGVVAGSASDGGQIFFGAYIGSEPGTSSAEISTGWQASPVLDLSDLNTSIISVGGWKDPQ